MAEHAPTERLGKFVRPIAPEVATPEEKRREEGTEVRKIGRDHVDDLGGTASQSTMI